MIKHAPLIVKHTKNQYLNDILTSEKILDVLGVNKL